MCIVLFLCIEIKLPAYKAKSRHKLILNKISLLLQYGLSSKLDDPATEHEMRLFFKSVSSNPVYNKK